MYLETLLVIDQQLSEGPNIWYLQRESGHQSWILVCIYNYFPYTCFPCSDIDFIDDPSPNNLLNQDMSRQKLSKIPDWSLHKITYSGIPLLRWELFHKNVCYWIQCREEKSDAFAEVGRDAYFQPNVVYLWYTVYKNGGSQKVTFKKCYFLKNK